MEINKHGVKFVVFILYPSWIDHHKKECPHIIATTKEKSLFGATDWVMDKTNSPVHLIFFHNQGVPKIMEKSEENLSWELVKDAACKGDLERLIILQKQGCLWGSHFLEDAAENGHLHILQWAKKKGYEKLYGSLTSSAAKGGQLLVLQWLIKHGCPWDDSASYYAAENGHLDVLKWAIDNGCPYDKYTCSYAAKGGHIEVLKWLRSIMCPWNECTSRMAIENNHLDVLEWAVAHGCEKSEVACTIAATKGNLDMLKWLRKNEFPWTRDVRVYAKKHGHEELLQWAIENGCPAECTCKRKHEMHPL